MHKCGADKQEFLQVVNKDIIKDGRFISSPFYGKVGALASSVALSTKGFIIIEPNEAIHGLIQAA